jgi:hypothetical protein
MVRKVREVELRGRFRVRYELVTMQTQTSCLLLRDALFYEVVKRADVSIQTRLRGGTVVQPTGA